MSYKCLKCKTILDELTKGMIRCPVCACRVLYKMRPQVSKTIQAR